MKTIKIFLIDDHQIILDGIKALLTDVKDIEVIGEASKSNEAIEKLRTTKPDVIVTDISMPDISGIELTRIITNEFPDSKVLILSMYTNDEFIFNAIKAGAKGYLHKNTTRKEILEAIYTINNGKEYFNEYISEIMLKGYVKKAQEEEKFHDKKEVILTNREIEILKHVAEGNSNQEIADKFQISIRTVESHKNHIMQKLELKTTVEMVKYAIRNKIIEI